MKPQLKNFATVGNGAARVVGGVGSAFRRATGYVGAENITGVENFYNRMGAGYDNMVQRISTATSNVYSDKSHYRHPDTQRNLPQRLADGGAKLTGGAMDKAGKLMESERWGPVVLLAAVVAAYYAVKRWIGRSEKKEEVQNTQDSTAIEQMRAETAMNRARAKEIYISPEAGQSNYMYPQAAEGMKDYHVDKYVNGGANKGLEERIH